MTSREIVERTITLRGGLIASDYNDAEAIGVTLDRRLVMFEALAEAGGYPDRQQTGERVWQAGQGEIGHSWSRQTVKPDKRTGDGIGMTGGCELPCQRSASSLRERDGAPAVCILITTEPRP